MECADSRHATLCDADSRGFIVVAFCSAILHHWMCKIPTEVATLTSILTSQGTKL
ncbi:transposase (plasmid) [Piscirickettsia salmonis]|uniref:Transposase n=1 Tax=Piscirickettsia salmonis TaxID=1238 RepID=A0AAC8VL56_PISSA|nr:transposase [Piscirickettsia salmonis]